MLRKGLFCFALLLLAATAASATVYRVDADSGAGSPDGSTWANAFPTIQAAIDHAVAQGASSGNPAELWVAEGTYTAAAHPVVTMAQYVHLYGGFAATETARSQRDWEANETIIDGENARGCIWTNSITSTTLDGFTVTRGRDDYGSGMHNYNSSPTVANCIFANNTTGISGGGMFNNVSSSTVTDCTFVDNSSTHGGGMDNYNCSPVVTNCTFSGNTVSNLGGGMVNTESYPTVTNCAFSLNAAAQGGGVHNLNSPSAALMNCTFAENTATEGAGMYSNSSSATVTNCRFLNNAANVSAGGMFNEGSSINLVNCTFSGNTAGNGGCMHNMGLTTVSAMNCTFAANRAVLGGLAYLYSGDTSFTNCIAWGNTPSGSHMDSLATFSATYSCIEGGSSGVGNIADDPLLVGADFGDTRLKPSSPCLNSGTSAGAPATDILGATRPLGTGVDMGAYECDDIAQLGAITVSLTGDPAVDANARWRINAGDWHALGETVDLYAGTYEISYLQIAGYATPATQETPLTAGQTLNLSADYSPSPGGRAVLRVDAAASGAGTGLSWTDAFTTIQAAVDAASAMGGADVWVAAGTYTSSSASVVELAEYVHVYGGFSGWETAAAARNWAVNDTIIDGENARPLRIRERSWKRCFRRLYSDAG